MLLVPQVELERTKADVLVQIREMITECDQTMRGVTVAYFQLQHAATAPLSVQVLVFYPVIFLILHSRVGPSFPLCIDTYVFIPNFLLTLSNSILVISNPLFFSKP